MLKWIKLIAIGVVGLLFLTLLIGIGYEQWGRYGAVKAHVPPGKVYQVAGGQMHLQCSGEGRPTVILEAGLDAGGSQSWANIFAQLAKISHVCAYDRAGMMWSEGSNQPRNAEQIADELHALLAVAAIPPPYVLVGHSLGGIFIRVFDHRFPEEVTGFVFVDSSHPEQIERFPPEINDFLPSTLLISALANTGGMRFMASANGPSVLPKAAGDAIVAFTPASMSGLAGEIDALDVTMSQAKQTGSLGEKPVVVLSAGKFPSDFPPEFTENIIDQMKNVSRELQGELAELSGNSDHRVIAEAMHYIHWDNPSVVVQAIDDVVVAVRQNARVRSKESNE